MGAVALVMRWIIITLLTLTGEIMADSTFPSLTSSVDVSSYKQPQATSFVDSLKGWQGVESNKLAIDKQKLDLINQNYQNMISDLVSLGPNPTPDQIQQAATNQVKFKRVTPEMAATFIGTIPTDPSKIPGFMQDAIGKLMSTNEATQWHYGRGIVDDNGQQRTYAVTSNKPGFGVRPISQPQQNQVPPTAERVDDNPNSPTYGQKGYVGPNNPQIPAGKLPVAGGLPGQFQDAPAPNMVRTEAIRPKLPVAPPAALPAPPAAPNPVAVPPIDNRSASIAERIAPVGQTGLIPTGLPPGVGEAKQKEAIGSAEALNEDRAAATKSLQSIIPLKQALALMPGLTTGIGTEPYNKVRAALINLGAISPSENDPTVIRQELDKKLKQFVSESSLGSTDAGKALIQSANPDASAHLIPALTKLARDALSQRRGDILRPNSYEGAPQDYNKHRTSFPQGVDQQALHIDQLPQNEREALINRYEPQVIRDNDGKVTGFKTKAAERFWKTLDLAHRHNLLD